MLEKTLLLSLVESHLKSLSLTTKLIESSSIARADGEGERSKTIGASVACVPDLPLFPLLFGGPGTPFV